MADNTNKVTIDAAWFAELYAKWKGAKTGERPCDGCPIVGDLDEMRAECGNLRNERDELKAKLSTAQNYEDVISAKDREIEAAKEERNRLNAKVNELMKQKEAAERCIEEMRSKMQTFDIPDRQRLIELESIIRTYREKEEK